jgi:hypothetical protein
MGYSEVYEVGGLDIGLGGNVLGEMVCSGWL